jgi:hypothetical protein
MQTGRDTCACTPDQPSRQIPVLLNVTSYDLRWTECFDELEGKIPRMQNIWCFDLFDPVSCANSHFFERLLYHCTCQKNQAAIFG